VKSKTNNTSSYEKLGGGGVGDVLPKYHTRIVACTHMGLCVVTH